MIRFLRWFLQLKPRRPKWELETEGPLDRRVLRSAMQHFNNRRAP